MCSRIVSGSGWLRLSPRSLALLALSLAPIHRAIADELVQPPVCSVDLNTAGKTPRGTDVCTVSFLGTDAEGVGHHEVKIDLTAKRGTIEVGGYSVETEHYNDNYVTPVVEAMPGDTVAAHLINLLPRSQAPQCQPGAMPGHGGHICANPTNLHYFHGGIVSPNNARPKKADGRDANGDNIYVHVEAGTDPNGADNSFDFDVPIPDALDARVLEGEAGKKIPHPLGLDWYHSHMHGISSDQVTGGMSGLLSVGDAKANLLAPCIQNPGDNTKCLNDVGKDTDELRKRTDAKYILLRDTPVAEISAPPREAGAKYATATWAPRDWDFPRENVPDEKCGVWGSDGSTLDTRPELRLGFCQRSDDTEKKSAWLFTLNGQRFPTITVPDGKNALLRMANVSANVAYWLELYKVTVRPDGSIVPVLDSNGEFVPVDLQILSLDGVVPAKPRPLSGPKMPAGSLGYRNLMFMPASRAEIFIGNGEPHPDRQFLVLRTKGPNMSKDHWPEIQLALIVLEPTTQLVSTEIALNAPLEAPQAAVVLSQPAAPVGLPTPPPGCVNDLNPAKIEHRRVTFLDGEVVNDKKVTDWRVRTEIMAPPREVGRFQEKSFKVSNAKDTVGPIPFEDYELPDGSIDWTKPHVCVFIDSSSHDGSHYQLWVLVNKTPVVHNFHIHQIKFRLARPEDLGYYHIELPENSHTCRDKPNCSDPDYLLYDDPRNDAPNSEPVWHDTMPIPPGDRVFLIMSFDAPQQVGRFVFHCHILKHEDNGLMAPIEVWSQSSGGS